MWQVMVVLLWAAEPAPTQGSALGLTDCVAEALRAHPDVKLSRNEVEAAEADRRGTRAGYLPRVELGLSEGYSFWGSQEVALGPTTAVRPAGDDPSHRISLTLTQNLYDGGKWWNRIQRAERAIGQAQLSVEATREEVALNAVAAFYELQKAGRQLGVLRASLELSQGQLELAEERKRLGAASKVDVAKARVAHGEDRIAIFQQESRVDSARIDLNLAMGRPPATPLVLREDEPDSPARMKDPAGWMDSHVQVRRFQKQAEVAALDVAISQGDWYPHLTGSISYGRQDKDFATVYTKLDQIYSLQFGLSLSFPLFDGFLTRSAVERAEVAQGRVVEEEKKTRLKLEGAWVRIEQEILRLADIARVETDNVQDAAQQLQFAQESYTVGQGTSLEVRDAQLALTRAKLVAVQTQYDLRLARARSRYAQGILVQTYLPEERYSR